MSSVLPKPYVTTLGDEAHPITLLLKGPSGSGKTTKAALFPRPAIFNFDNNLSSLRKLPTEVRAGIKVYTPSIDNEGKPIKPEKVWDVFVKQLEEAMNDSTIDTIVIDSLSTLGAIVENCILKTGAFNAVMQIQDWGAFTRYIQWLLESCCATPSLKKHVIVTAHEDHVMQKGSSIGDLPTLARIEVLLPTKVKNKIELHFSDVWRTEVKSTPVGVSYLVNTRPSNLATAKCSLPIVGKEIKDQFDWDKDGPTVIKYINELTTKLRS